MQRGEEREYTKIKNIYNYKINKLEEENEIPYNRKLLIK